MSYTDDWYFAVMDSRDRDTVVATCDGEVWTLARNDDSFSLPILTALDVAAETVRLLLDEEHVMNGPGFSLSEWIGYEDSEELRRLLSKITGPVNSTFTTPHC